MTSQRRAIASRKVRSTVFRESPEASTRDRSDSGMPVTRPLRVAISAPPSRRRLSEPGRGVQRTTSTYLSSSGSRSGCSATYAMARSQSHPTYRCLSGLSRYFSPSSFRSSASASSNSSTERPERTNAVATLIKASERSVSTGPFLSSSSTHAWTGRSSGRSASSAA